MCQSVLSRSRSGPGVTPQAGSRSPGRRYRWWTVVIVVCPGSAQPLDLEAILFPGPLGDLEIDQRLLQLEAVLSGGVVAEQHRQRDTEGRRGGDRLVQSDRTGLLFDPGHR